MRVLLELETATYRYPFCIHFSFKKAPEMTNLATLVHSSTASDGEVHVDIFKSRSVCSETYMLKAIPHGGPILLLVVRNETAIRLHALPVSDVALPYAKPLSKHVPQPRCHMHVRWSESRPPRYDGCHKKWFYCIVGPSRYAVQAALPLHPPHQFTA